MESCLRVSGVRSWAPPALSRCPGSLRNPARSSPLCTASRGRPCVGSCPGETTCNTEDSQGTPGHDPATGSLAWPGRVTLTGRRRISRPRKHSPGLPL